MQRKFFMLAALVCSTYSQAQQNNADSLQDVVVTATKFPAKQQLSTQVMSVITSAQLELSGGKDLSQILTEQAGLIVNGAYSNTGKDKSIFLRGATASATIIMLDGVPVYDPSGISSNFDPRLIPTNSIERIEILKGSQSTLYGADAIAGVINIISKKGKQNGIHASGQYSAGTYNTFQQSTSLHGKLNKMDFSVTASQNNTDGISEATDSNGDTDGFKNRQIRFNLGYQANKNWHITPYFSYQSFENDIDNGAFSDDKDYNASSINRMDGLQNQWQWGATHIRLNYNHNSIDRVFLNDTIIKSSPFDGLYSGSFSGREHLVDLYLQTPIANGLSLTTGIDYRNSNVTQENFGTYKYEFDGTIYTGTYESKISNDSAKQRQTAVYAALKYNNNQWILEAGGRYNDHSEYGNNFVYQGGLGYLLKNNIKFYLNISSGYKVPSLYQLYSEYRNPVEVLKPEQSVSYEAGAAWQVSDDVIRVTGFKRQMKDVIFFYFDANTFASYYINQDKQNDYGIEAEFRKKIFSNLLLTGNYTFVKGEVTTSQNGKDTTYNNLIRRPKHSWNIALNYALGHSWNLSLSALGTGKRQDLDFSAFPAAQITLDSYVLLNASLYKQLNSNIRIFCDVRNIFNSKFTEVYGYNTQGRFINGGIQLSL